MTWLELENQNDILHTGYKSEGQTFSILFSESVRPLPGIFFKYQSGRQRRENDRYESMLP
jgi:hypothetical protein